MSRRGTGWGEVQVLLVFDDDLPGADAAVEMVSQRPGTAFTVARTAEDALGSLDRADVPRPDLILVSLSRTLEVAIGLLEEIKSDAALHAIPVVVLTPEATNGEVVRIYSAGANCYIARPPTIDALQEVLLATITFWTEVVELPPKNRRPGLGGGLPGSSATDAHGSGSVPWVRRS